MTFMIKKMPYLKYIQVQVVQKLVTGQICFIECTLDILIKKVSNMKCLIHFLEKKQELKK